MNMICNQEMATSTIFSLKKWIPPPRFVFSQLVVVSSFLNIIPSNYANNNVLSACKFDAIYQFGDSISDTGNDIQQYPISRCGNPPYGEAFFRKPTGRCSNGLLMIDFIALSAEIPFLDAYFNKDGWFAHGVNFAYAGATALPQEGRMEKYLRRQLDWMSSYFDRICSYDKDCMKKNERALFIVGEIGGNDYNHALRTGKTLEEVTAKVVQAIKDAIKGVIGYGALRIIVPGNFPIGCFPMYLTTYQTNDTNAYDQLHCLKDINNLSIYHNDLLQQAIEELKEEYPNVIIVYGNYYNAFLWFFSKANLLGFDPKSLQKACCGIGGDYNSDILRRCGEYAQVTVCPNPDERVFWDDVHLTQRAYKLIAAWLIRDIYPKLQCHHTDSYTSAA